MLTSRHVTFWHYIKTNLSKQYVIYILTLLGLQDIMTANDPCILSQEAILAADNCASPFTNLSVIATGTSFGITLNQLDQDLKMICSNSNCRRSVMTYLDMCAVSYTNAHLCIYTHMHA